MRACSNVKSTRLGMGPDKLQFDRILSTTACRIMGDCLLRCCIGTQLMHVHAWITDMFVSVSSLPMVLGMLLLMPVLNRALHSQHALITVTSSAPLMPISLTHHMLHMPLTLTGMSAC